MKEFYLNINKIYILHTEINKFNFYNALIIINKLILWNEKKKKIFDRSKSLAAYFLHHVTSFQHESTLTIFLRKITYIYTYFMPCYEWTQKSPLEDKLKVLGVLDGVEEIIAKISRGQTAGGLIATRLGFGNRGVGMSRYTCR